MDRKLIEARLNLARQFLQHSLRRFFSHDEAEGAGLDDFLTKYRDDNIFQIEQYERDRYPSFARCIQCNICQPHCVMYRAMGYTEFPGPMAVASTLSRALSELAMTSGVIYNCTMCRLCETTCPENVPIAEIVGFIRKYIFKYTPNMVPAPLKEQCQIVAKSGNTFGEEAPYNIYEKESAEYVLFLGCKSRFRQSGRVEAAVSMLNKMAIDFTTIDEVCCGAPLKAGGCETDPMFSRTNIERIREKKTAKVITLCPHCQVAFAEGREYSGRVEPIHIAELLPQLNPAKASRETVTYHDPCMLGRVCGIFNEPRQALEWAGAKIVEMKNSKDLSLCCGNWGGLGLTNPDAAQTIAARRLEDARSVGAEVLLTECPWCLEIFHSTSLSGGKPRVRSVIEYLTNPET